MTHYSESYNPPFEVSPIITPISQMRNLERDVEELAQDHGGCEDILAMESVL